MDLSIIIVSYNTKEVLRNCLESIRNSRDKLLKEVIVVDNASTDGSKEMINDEFSDTRLITNKNNLGFAKANNIGVKVAKGKHVWLLNSDTVLIKDTIQVLYDMAVKNKSKIASCKLLNPNGSIQPQGGGLPKLRNIAAWMLFVDDLPLLNNLFEPYQQRKVSYFKNDRQPGWLSGTALLVDRELYLSMGGLDEAIFMYGEDVEFGIRAAKMGVRIDYFAKPSLVHLGQGGGSNRRAIVGEFKGIKYIFEKHKAQWEMPFLKTLLYIGAGLRWLIFGLIMRDKIRKEAYAECLSLV